jgi:transcriptional regulator with XRE-family HTH domain
LELLTDGDAVGHSEVYEAFGAAVVRFRKRSGKTQAQVAKEIGISRASLANIEAGNQRVFLDQIIRLAGALDLDRPDELLMSLPPLLTIEARGEQPAAPGRFSAKQKREIAAAFHSIKPQAARKTVDAN